MTEATIGPSTLVTGAGGFIGRWVVEELTARGVPCISVHHAWSGASELDVIIAGREVDRCIHLGWYTAPHDYLTSVPANLRSLISSLELTEALITKGCRHLVVAGSSAEYRSSDADLEETAPIDPATVYGVAKASLRVALRDLWRREGRSLTWARIFGVTGPGEHPGRLIPAVIRSVLGGMPIDLSDGAQIRDYLDVRDVAAALASLSMAKVEGDVNVCSGQGRSIRDVLEEVVVETGGRDLLRFGTLARKPGEVSRVVGTNRVIRAAVPWTPRIALPTTVRDLLAVVGAESDRPRRLLA